jgi:hypothetical protein
MAATFEQFKRRRTTRHLAGAGGVLLVLGVALFAIADHRTSPAHVVSHTPTSAATVTTTAPPAIVEGVPLGQLALIAHAIADVYGESHPVNVRVAVGSEQAADRLIVNGTSAYNFGTTAPAYVLAMDGNFACAQHACSPAARRQRATTIVLTLDRASFAPIGGTSFLRYSIDLAPLGRVYSLGAYPGSATSSSFAQLIASSLAQNPSPQVIPTVPVADCEFGDLAFDFYVGGAGTGNDFATIRIRDVGAQPCMYQDPVDLVGTDARGNVVTQSLHYAGGTAIFLSAHTARIPDNAEYPFPPGVAVADVLIAAEYRDGPAPDGRCHTPVIPAFFRLTLTGGTQTLANVSRGVPQAVTQNGFVTCNGQLDTPSPISPE